MLKDKPDETSDGLWRKDWPGEQKLAKADLDETGLALINQFTPEPVGKEDVWTGSMKLANDQYDRADERFPKAYLQRFAETLPGKSVMLAHDYRTAPVGRFYDAEVRQDQSGSYLHAKYFLNADGPVTGDVRKGIMGHVSIGFQPDERLCDLCGKDYDGAWKSYSSSRAQADDDPCSHILGRDYNGRKCTVTYGGDLTKVEAQEGSFVWLGCQRGAETTRMSALANAHKAAHFDALAPAGGKQGESMDEKEKLAAAAREKELTAEIERLKPLAADGERYREWLKSEISRLHTSLEEGETAGAILKALDSADAASLDAVRVEVDKRHAAAFAKGGAESGVEQKTAETPRLSHRELMFGATRRGGE